MSTKPLFFMLIATLLTASVWSGEKARNVASQATVTASSEYSKTYQARFVTDGKVPNAGGKNDAGKAWCVKGNSHPKGVSLIFTWKDAVPVAEVVYYGRTAWESGENWKDYELYVDNAKAAAAKGALKRGHGPQRIKLPKSVKAKKLTLKFLNSHGGSNPGASEIQVFTSSPSAKELPKFVENKGPQPKKVVTSTVPESSELAKKLKAGELGFTKILLIERHQVRSSHVYTYHCEGQRDGGGVYVLDVKDGTLKELLKAPDSQILGVDLSYDAKQILFSWRKDKFYQLYRMNIDGTGLKQLTDGEHFNYDGCFLPDGGIGFLSTRTIRYAYCWTSPAGILFRMEADGSKVRQISANYLNDFTPSVFSDGSIMYGRWEYVDRPAIPIQSLWTINPDGSMLRGYFGNRVLGPATFIEQQPIPGTLKVLCTMTGHNGSCRGAIGILDPSKGVNSMESIRNLTPEIRLKGVEVSSNGPRGPYQTPYPLDDKYFLVSKDGTILLRDYDGKEQVTVIETRGMGFYNPRPIRPRKVPPVRPGVGKPTDEPWATMYVQDVRVGMEEHVKPGEVKRIAVVQEIEKSVFAHVKHRAFGFQFPVVSCGATYAPKKVWGYAKVEEDGSAHFKVPSNVPFYFIALDAEGRAVQRMRSFTHVMPGERQGCVGCHSDRNSVAPIMGIRPAAVQREAQPLIEPEWGVTGFSYPHIVQPVLNKHCVKCHSGSSPPNGVDLCGDFTDFFNVSYETLARQGFDKRWGGKGYTSSISTYNGAEKNILQVTPKFWGSPASTLAKLIAHGHPDKDGDPRIKMTSAERLRIYTWIDLNIPYYGSSTSQHTELQGCRRMYPKDLDAVLKDVQAKRCNACHKKKLPRRIYTRVTNIEANRFLMAPLAKKAGGTERCGKAIFASKEDPDYQRILKTFEPVTQLIKETPREDMIDGAGE